MFIKGTLSISYRQEGVSVRINDEESRAEFVDAIISYEQFSRALSSLQSRPMIECEVRGLDNVGKRRVVERRSIRCPIKSYDRGELQEWLKIYGKEEGWSVIPSLGSQGSVSRDEAGTLLRYFVERYEEVPSA